MNIGLALLYLFPDAKPLIDYVVMKDGSNEWIDEWHLKEPKPTDQELEAAYKEYMKNPPVISSPSETLTEIQTVSADLIKENENLKNINAQTLDTLSQYQQLNADLIRILAEKGLL